MAVLKEFIVETIPVDEIEVVGTRRPINEGTVKSLMESIFGSEGQEGIGLQTPITIRSGQDITDPDTGELVEGFALIAGRHRLEAYRRHGEARIPAIVRNCDELDAELWEIDENLCRSELTEAQEAQALKRRKELWTEREERRQSEQLEPIESKRADGRGHRSEGFAAETAKITGESKQSINRKISRAEKIAPDVMEAIMGTEHDKGVVLDVLRKLTHDEQRQALARVQSGSSPNFQDAYDFIRGGEPAPKPKPVPKPPEPMNDIETRDRWLASGMAWWNRGSQEWREEFLSRIDRPVMDNTMGAPDDTGPIPEFLRR